MESDSGDNDGVTSGPSEFFEQRGFRLRFSRPSEQELEALYAGQGALRARDYRRLRREGMIGPVLATLESTTNAAVVLEAYGTGANEDEAAARARHRWLSEQGD